MFLQLGTYKFEGVKLPEIWTGSFVTNYGQIPIVNSKPILQKTGEKLHEYDISALFSDEFCNPLEEIEALQLYRINGDVLQLTGGDGVNYGRFVISEITRTNQRASADGYISMLTANIKLLEYNSTSTTKKVVGQALVSASPKAETPLPVVQSIPFQITADITEAEINSNRILDESKKTGLNYKLISQYAANAQTAWDAANTKIQNTKKIIYRATQLQNTITNAKSAMAFVQEAATVENLNDLYAANTILEQAVYNTRGASAPVAAFVGSREGGEQ